MLKSREFWNRKKETREEECSGLRKTKYNEHDLKRWKNHRYQSVVRIFMSLNERLRYQKIMYDDAFPETSTEDLMNLLNGNFDLDTVLTF